MEPFKSSNTNSLDIDVSDIVRELRVRDKKSFILKEFCHPKQYDFLVDPAPFADAVTTRKAGKTTGSAAHLCEVSRTHSNKVSVYITLSRLNAKRIMWPKLLEINHEYRLGAMPNISDLSLTFPSRSVIYLAGVNDSQAIQNFRGLSIKLAYLDEMQAMRPYVKELMDDILGPALIDEAGIMRVTGTPGAVPVGYFHDLAHSPNWSHHFFTLFDNPFLEQKSGMTAQQLLDRELKRRGVTIDDPTIQREFFGRWVTDIEALVIRYQKEINDYNSLPEGMEWEYVVGVDVGLEDADAIAVLAFSEKHKTAYLVEEMVQAKQGITELANQIQSVIRRFKPRIIKMDTGGLGLKIAEEMRRRFGLPIEAAEKSRKFEFIELLNDALRTGKFMAKVDSRFAQEAQLLEWDRENPEKPKISDRFHSDIVDAVLYAFRECLHWLFVPEIPKPKMGSPEAIQQIETDLFEEVQKRYDKSEDEKEFWKDPFD